VQPEYIAVGRFGRLRGFEGEIFVTPLTDFPDRFLDMKSVFVSVNGRWDLFEIESTEMVGGRPVIKLKTINTPEDAARLAQCELAVTRDQVVPLAPDRYYVFDLIGCAAIDAGTGEPIGTIADVQRYPANDVYVISDEQGHRWICPVVSNFVRSVDIAARQVVIERSGLLAAETG
jgi:16S rRNA processing protein RimM